MSLRDVVDDGPTDEQLTRLVLRVLAAIVTLTLAGGIASAAGRLDERNDANADKRDPSTISAGLAPQGGVGPLAGTAIAAYVRQRLVALSDVKGNRVAVVSFAGYRTQADATALLGGVDVKRLLVAVPSGRPLEADSGGVLDEVVTRQRADAEEERKALLALLPTVEDADFKAQYEVDIARLTALLAAPAQISEVVFGAVVVGTADQLRTLAQQPGVRLVDVGADAEIPLRGTVTGLRPEETTAANTPETRP